MNNDIQRYLNRASRGTWGRKRAEIKEELAAHIETRVNVHRSFGASEERAVEKTLRELGQPSHVSAGMTRLHSTPTILGSSLLFISALALSITILSGTVAQVLIPLPHLPTTCLFRAV